MAPSHVHDSQSALLRYLAFTFVTLRRIDLRQDYDAVGQLESYGSLYDKYGAPFQWTFRGLHSWAKRACVFVRLDSRFAMCPIDAAAVSGIRPALPISRWCSCRGEVGA